MGKVQILAVLTMDGCLSSELYDKAHQDLCLDRCGLDEIRKKAFYRVTPDYSISMLHEWRKDCTNIRYLAEATPDTADYGVTLALGLITFTLITFNKFKYQIGRASCRERV